MAYASSASTRRRIKDEVLAAVSGGVSPVPLSREIYRLGATTVHARYCASGPDTYGFNINPNTLRADYELWICGTVDQYYLIPMSIIQEMYQHPKAYPDTHHPEIRVVNVDTRACSVRYASPSISLDLQPYFCGRLSAS